MALSHRPYLRSPLAKSLYERMLKEERLRNLDKSQWYECDLTQMNPGLRDLFTPCCYDPATEDFLDSCYEKSDWLFTQIFHSLAKSLLCWFMTRTSINGLLGRGSMFIFSTSHFQSLMGIDPSWRAHSLLDLGAGDGKVTEIMAPYFHNISVTEMSPIMRRVLSKKGYRILEVDKWANEPTEYDVISCLNLLDRCDRPLTLLGQIKVRLKPHTGRLLIAAVLPLSQYVETGRSGHQPSERLAVEGTTFEAQVESLSKVLETEGYEIVRWTRLPYLCEGDIEQSFYWLDDVVMVLKLKSEEGGS